MMEAKAWPPIGIMHSFENGTGHVDAGVAHEEEHCQNGRHSVKLADSNSTSTQNSTGKKRQSRLLTGLHCKNAQDRESFIAGNGTQEACAGHEARETGTDG
mmetsp:Transcript_93883/g.172029  ORF Transcript_93883/g.172029 Transcript_93883/m.172029 type:complete len:101 (+) Transcript_93883:933-1235(+)